MGGGGYQVMCGVGRYWVMCVGVGVGGYRVMCECVGYWVMCGGGRVMCGGIR